MAGSQPDPLVLFFLRPLNKQAEAVVDNPNNDHFVSTLEDGTRALGIGHVRSNSSNGALTTLGRAADIYVPGSSIARQQCSFEIDPDTGVVMLYDRSHTQTTQVYGENATPFEHGRLRKVVVQEDLNTEIGMGGEGRNLFLFKLVWKQNAAQTMMKIKDRENLFLGHSKENPRHARTVANTPQHQLKIRYAKMNFLGSGQFGQVWKAVNADSGKLMAVKILRQAPEISKPENWAPFPAHALKREVEMLSELSHPHVVNFIASQGWGGPTVEIFIGLKDGTLNSLIEGSSIKRENLPAVARSILYQMLQALDYLAFKGIIHRDVKPANILCESQPDGQYNFQLGDFRLCNRVASAETIGIGSPLSMAPEMWQNVKQTPKVDVWSLCVTMLWTFDMEEFRKVYFRSRTHIPEAVVSIASRIEPSSPIRDMAIINPEYRASAAQILVKTFNGEGLSTPRHSVPALTNGPTIPVAINPASAPPTMATGAAPSIPGVLGGNTDAFASAAPPPMEEDWYAQASGQAINQMTEKRRGPASGPALASTIAGQYRVPGAFPRDDATASGRKRH